MTQVVLRRADQADAASLAAIGAATFSESFGHLYPPADLAAFLDAHHTAEAAARGLADPRLAVWLLEEWGAPIGYALAGPCALPHPEVTAACGELKRIYVLRGRQGGGRGTRLLETALAWLEREHRGRLWIGVYSGNEGAQRLYRRHGFEPVGTYAFEVGASRDAEIIMRR